MDFFAQLIESMVVGTISIAAIFGFYGKSISEHIFKRNFEAFRSELNSLSDREKLRFSRMFEEKTTRLLALYDGLIELHNSLVGLSRTTSQEMTAPEAFIFSQSYTKVIKSSQSARPFLESGSKSLLDELLQEIDRDLEKEDADREANLKRKASKLISAVGALMENIANKITD